MWSLLAPLGGKRMHGRWRGTRLEDLYGLAGLGFPWAGTERRRRLLLLLLLWRERLLLQRLRPLRNYLLDGQDLRFDYGSFGRWRRRKRRSSLEGKEKSSEQLFRNRQIVFFLPYLDEKLCGLGESLFLPLLSLLIVRPLLLGAGMRTRRMR